VTWVVVISLAAGMLAGYLVGSARSDADLAALDRDLAQAHRQACEQRTEGEADALASCREANRSCAWAFGRLAEREDGCHGFLFLGPPLTEEARAARRARSRRAR
jgi:hypothetical protein